MPDEVISHVSAQLDVNEVEQLVADVAEVCSVVLLYEAEHLANSTLPHLTWCPVLWDQLSHTLWLMLLLILGSLEKKTEKAETEKERRVTLKIISPLALQIHIINPAGEAELRHHMLLLELSSVIMCAIKGMTDQQKRFKKRSQGATNRTSHPYDLIGGFEEAIMVINSSPKGFRYTALVYSSLVCKL